ncbi:MAG: MarC family protein [SAR324 cluster bacterium]|nr:MarC family protein [SAR324 cluster bacterium]
MIDFIATFIIFFSVIDPIGTVPVFIAVTNKHNENEKSKIAFLAIIVSASVLLFFIIVGELILNAMSIPLAAFQISGGIVLFLFALSMIFGESKPDEEVKLATKYQDTAVFPLAVPSIAGPGAMLAAVLMTENARYSFLEQLQTAGVMLFVLLLVYCLMLSSKWINRIIGDSGASIISRVMGLILASVATANTLSGLKTYFNL